jgi:hypothetical protein
MSLYFEYRSTPGGTGIVTKGLFVARRAKPPIFPTLTMLCAGISPENENRRDHGVVPQWLPWRWSMPSAEALGPVNRL